MNKKVLVILAAVLLLLAGGWYFMSNKSGVETSTDGNATVNQDSGSTSLKDLLTKGKAQTCTYSAEGGSGKVYVSGEKMRGDFETKVEAKTMTSHMIVKDNTSYVWTDDQKTGFKMTFDPKSVDTSVSSDTSVSNQAADLNANYDYKCSAWKEDSSQFALPSGVTFTSFDIPVTGTQTAPQQGGASGSSGSSQQCSYCNALTGSDKAECLQALKCN
jgi:hypothetical protein